MIQAESLKKEKTVFYIGLMVYLIMNLLLAFYAEVHFDEAYYWLYSMYPQWGYFDHPPMVAWFIMMGTAFFKGSVGLRLLPVLSNGLALWMLWSMVRKYKPDALLFWALVYSVVLIHPYGLFATPDAPLFFFSVLFFYAYRNYGEKANFSDILFLSFAMALMVYSKYHGFLVIGFTLISNLKIIKSWKTWLLAIFFILYLVPHGVWQFENGFPSIHYHLIDSHTTPYKFKVTIEYVVNLLLLTGPWMGWFFLFILFRIKSTNPWERALQYTGTGIIVFFLLATFGGDFEAHWALVACIPLIVLSYHYIADHPQWRKWVLVSGTVNFVVLTIVKIIFMTSLAAEIPGLKTIAGWKSSDMELKEKSQGLPVVFQDAWNHAARFAYNTNDMKVAHLNSAWYRRNQYNMIDLDEELAGGNVYLITRDPQQVSTCDTIVTSKTTYYGAIIENFRSYYNLRFDTSEVKIEKGIFSATLHVYNPYDDLVVLGKPGDRASFQLTFPGKKNWEVLVDVPVDSIRMTEGMTAIYPLSVVLPENITEKTELYLVLKIGELKPIPVRYRMDHLLK